MKKPNLIRNDVAGHDPEQEVARQRVLGEVTERDEAVKARARPPAAPPVPKPTGEISRDAWDDLH
jgi:hypothetical protein